MVDLDVKWFCKSCAKGFDVPSEFVVYLDETKTLVMDIIFKCPFCNSDRIEKNATQLKFF